jgi:hypothetical protein
MLMLLPTAVLALSLQGPAVVDRGDVAHPVVVAESWDDLNQSQRDRALKNYQRYMQLPEEKRRNIDQRYERWKKMPDRDRDRYRRKHHDMGFADD